MGIKERRDIEKMEMRKKIMNTAIDIIEQEGYEKLSIRKIAAKIEYSPTTIYLYYKDKADIITDISNELYNNVMDDVAAAMVDRTTSPVEEQFRDILRIFVKGLCSEPEMVKAIMHSGIDVIFANDNTREKPNNKGIDMCNKFISFGIDQKVFRPNIENTSWMIVSALLGFVLSSIGNQLYLLDDFNQLVSDFIELLMGGMKS